MKRKYIIAIFVIIVIIASVCFIKFKMFAGNKQLKLDIQKTNIEGKDETYSENESQETVKSENSISDEKVNVKSEEEIEKSVINNTSQDINETTRQQEPSESKPNTVIENSNLEKDTPKKETAPVVVANPIEKDQNVEDKKIENTEVVTSNEPKEKYIYNEQMTQNIMNIIKNNPSQDMITYGYNIVIDSSIMQLTNQFTFTERRIKEKITLKFGTIRIYAQDYYNLGKYICTQCFII